MGLFRRVLALAVGCLNLATVEAHADAQAPPLDPTWMPTTVVAQYQSFGAPRSYYYPPTSPANSAVPAQPIQFWYFCKSAGAYFPDVRSCPEAWQPVSVVEIQKRIATATAAWNALDTEVLSCLRNEQHLDPQRYFSAGVGPVDPSVSRQMSVCQEYAARQRSIRAASASWDALGPNMLACLKRNQGIEPDKFIATGADPQTAQIEAQTSACRPIVEQAARIEAARSAWGTQDADVMDCLENQKRIEPNKYINLGVGPNDHTVSGYVTSCREIVDRRRQDEERQRAAAEKQRELAEERRRAAIAEQAAIEERTVFHTTAPELYLMYESNEVAADDKIGGRLVQVSGMIQSIDKNFLDEVVVLLFTGNEFDAAMMHMVATERPKAATLRRGQVATIRCKGMQRLMGSPVGRGCVFQ